MLMHVDFLPALQGNILQTASSEIQKDPERIWLQAHEWFAQRQDRLLFSFEQALQVENLPHLRALSREVIETLLRHELQALLSFFELSRDSTQQSDPRSTRQEHTRFVRDQLRSVPAAEQLRFLGRRQEIVQRLILDDSSNGTFRPLLLLRLDIAITYGRVLIQRLDFERDKD